MDDRDLVQRRVELSVAVAVEAVAALLAGEGVERGDSGESRELRFGAKSSGAPVSPMILAAISAPQPVSSSSCGASSPRGLRNVVRIFADTRDRVTGDRECIARRSGRVQRARSVTACARGP